MWNPFTPSPADGRDDGETEPPDALEIDPEAVPVVPGTETDGLLVEHVLEAVGEVIDPEVGVNIVDLGLVYAVEDDGSTIRVAVTATTPACPMADAIRQDTERAARRAAPDDRDVRVHLVWEPAWSPEFMTDDAREKLGGLPGSGSGTW